ncbi:MAG: hypothetical protein M1819_000326 [Sarea resinae]|nr:MAG: hypothetical protein M1819_000326 [Sarea resinae]
MPYLFSQKAGKRQPIKTLDIVEYVGRLDNGLLTPTTKSLGFKTYVKGTIPPFPGEEEYINQFCKLWAAAVEEVALEFSVTPAEVDDKLDCKEKLAPTSNFTFSVESALRESSKTKSYVAFGDKYLPSKHTSTLNRAIDAALRKSAQTQDFVSIDSKIQAPAPAPALAPALATDITFSIESALRESKRTGEFTPFNCTAVNTTQTTNLSTIQEEPSAIPIYNHPHAIMSAQRPTVQVSGLPGPSKSDSTVSPARQSMRMNMFKRMRPDTFPLRYHWEIWHDRQVQTAAAAGSTQPGYEDRLTSLHQVSDVKTFWEVFNNIPFDALPLRDSIHFFKRTVKPVWEDPRNVRGGAWTFRVPKSTGKDFYLQILLMAIGDDTFQVEKGDDICGVSLSIRFTSNLITVWNRDGSNLSSINGIRDAVLANLPSEHMPKDEKAYYYKRHDEHAGFSESVAKAKEMEKLAKGTKDEDEVTVAVNDDVVDDPRDHEMEEGEVGIDGMLAAAAAATTDEK